MRSVLRFVMHPDDESAFVDALLREAGVVFVDGPRWTSNAPQTTRNISKIGEYCIIWSPSDLAALPAEFIPECQDWYCRGEYATIQFLRSRLVGPVAIEGSIAVATDPLRHRKAAQVELRFKSLRRLIKKSYRNSIVRWFNPNFPTHPATRQASANPSEPDRSLWVGPAALEWLANAPNRRIKVHESFPVEGAIRI